MDYQEERGSGETLSYYIAMIAPEFWPLANLPRCWAAQKIWERERERERERDDHTNLDVRETSSDHARGYNAEGMHRGLSALHVQQHHIAVQCATPGRALLMDVSHWDPRTHPHARSIISNSRSWLTTDHSGSSRSCAVWPPSWPSYCLLHRLPYAPTLQPNPLSVPQSNLLSAAPGASALATVTPLARASDRYPAVVMPSSLS